MEEKICKYCYEKLERRPDETAGNFNKRQYCSKMHSSLHQSEKGNIKKTPFAPVLLKNKQTKVVKECWR